VTLTLPCFDFRFAAFGGSAQGELQYFIGVQLDGTHYLEPERRRLSQKTESEGVKVVQKTADNIDGALRELPDANMVSHQNVSLIPLWNESYGIFLLFYIMINWSYLQFR